MPAPLPIPACDGAHAFNREPSYSRQRVAFALEFDSRGQYGGVQPLGRADVYGHKTMVVPRPLRGRLQDGPNFLCDGPRFALGLRSVGPLYEMEPDYAAFAAFRDLHSTVLQGSFDTAVRAFLRFLDGWDPLSALSLPGLGQLRSRNLVFRFRYDDVFLHERHAVQVAWRRRLAAMEP